MEEGKGEGLRRGGSKGCGVGGLKGEGESRGKKFKGSESGGEEGGEAIWEVRRAWGKEKRSGGEGKREEGDQLTKLVTIYEVPIEVSDCALNLV